MKTNTQSLVMDAIEVSLKSEGYSTVVDSEYGNTGRIFAVAPGNIGGNGRFVRYDFQDSIVKFAFWEGPTSRSKSRSAAKDQISLQKLVDDVAEYLTTSPRSNTAKPKKNRIVV